MKFVAQVKGNIAEYMKLEAEGGARAASRVMGEEARKLQLDLRAQMNSVFGASGVGLGNAWRSKTYPRRQSLGAAGLVWSKVPAIVNAFTEGALIRPKGGKKFLAIATGFNLIGGKRRRKKRGEVEASNLRVTPKQMVASKQAFMRPFKSGKGFVWCLPLKRGEGTGKQRRTRLMAGGITEVGTANRKGREAWARGLLVQGMVPMFLLLPAVNLPKRLDIRKPAEQAGARIPGRFVAEWDKEVRANVRT
jgi:hypothetical protein